MLTFAALAVSHWIERQTGWSIKKFVRTARRRPLPDDLCIPEDSICSPIGGDNGAHGAYAIRGLTDQPADFAVGKLPPEALVQPVDQAAAHG